MQSDLNGIISNVKTKRRNSVPEQQIYDYFMQAIEILIARNRLSAMDIIIKGLKEFTDEGNLIDPSIRDGDVNIWRWCFGAFLKINDYYAADSIIEHCYLHLLDLQRKHKARYHKGVPLYTRAEGLLRVGRNQSAKRFILLAHIEDIITGQIQAPAWQTLKLAGVSEQDLKLVESETKSLMENKICFYPEEVLQHLQYRLEYGTLGEFNREFAFTNPIFLEELINRVVSASLGEDNEFKRTSMEGLAQYLFSSIEGLFVKPSTRAGPYELDGIIINTSNHPFLKTLDTYIPIECKNWKEPIGAPEITQFIGKMNLFKCRYGILISKEGIKEKTVNELRKDAYRRTDISILIFSEDDIRLVINGKDLVSLLIEKYEELKFSINI